MDEEIRIPVSLPLDNDGFLRRECPNCEREFKWFNQADDDSDIELASQYFCPRCGDPADTDAWWTPAQLEYSHESAGGAIEEAVTEAVDGMFKGLKLQPNRSFSLDLGTPDPLTEQDDMVIVEPPCHAQEPLKVPEDATGKIFCLICGTPFTA